MDLIVYRNIPSRLRTGYEALLSAAGLQDEGNATATALAMEDGKIMGCCSLRHNILCQLAVSEACQEGGLAARLVSALVQEAVDSGFGHLFMCTKPEHHARFGSLGFYPIAQTAEMLFMENSRSGFQSFLEALPKFPGENGAIVCNCDPMTLGHLRLMEYAATQCGHLYVFVLSEDAGLVSASERFRLVREATAHLPNVSVHRSADYLISRATFPAYFLKAETDPEQARADLDLTVFGQRIAPALGITRRFVGEEPFCPVTAAYNAQMMETLPRWGVEVEVRPRKDGISASRVRTLFAEGALEELRSMVPEVTYAYLRSISSTDP